MKRKKIFNRFIVSLSVLALLLGFTSVTAGTQEIILKEKLKVSLLRKGICYE